MGKRKTDHCVDVGSRTGESLGLRPGHWPDELEVVLFTVRYKFTRVSRAATSCDERHCDYEAVPGLKLRVVK